jgi:hypothetical protein
MGRVLGGTLAAIVGYIVLTTNSDDLSDVWELLLYYHEVLLYSHELPLNLYPGDFLYNVPVAPIIGIVTSVFLFLKDLANARLSVLRTFAILLIPTPLAMGGFVMGMFLYLL